MDLENRLARETVVGHSKPKFQSKDMVKQPPTTKKWSQKIELDNKRKREEQKKLEEIKKAQKKKEEEKKRVENFYYNALEDVLLVYH